MVDGDEKREKLATVASAIRSSVTARELSASLGELGIPLMALKGPPVQRRLLGTDVAYRSQDLDLLVPAGDGGRARRLLEAQGWSFSAENGLMWRLDRAAAFTRDQVTVDLHWGLHAGIVSARRLRLLERALWRGAERSAEGWYEPRPEPLVVYLGVHGAAAGFRRREQLSLLAGGAKLVTDWAEVEDLARGLGMWRPVQSALAASEGRSPGELGLDDLHRGRVTAGVVFARTRLLRPGLRHWARVQRARLRRRRPPGAPSAGTEGGQSGTGVRPGGS